MTTSLVDEGWQLHTAVLSFHTIDWTLFWGFRADKTSTTHWSGGRVQVWVQVQAPAYQCLSSGNHSLKLLEKNRRFWLQYQWPSSWGRAPAAPAQLGRVGRASTNTGRFRVGSSLCWPRTSNTQFSLLNWHEPMAEWSYQVGRLGFDSRRVLNPSATPLPFCVALSPSMHWHGRVLFCCALYYFSSSWISSVAISRWQGFNS